MTRDQAFILSRYGEHHHSESPPLTGQGSPNASYTLGSVGHGNIGFCGECIRIGAKIAGGIYDQIAELNAIPRSHRGLLGIQPAMVQETEHPSDDILHGSLKTTGK